jgi:hypothetical protein
MTEVHLAASRTIRFLERRMIWVSGRLRSLPGDPNGRQPLYLPENASVEPAAAPILADTSGRTVGGSHQCSGEIPSRLKTASKHDPRPLAHKINTDVRIQLEVRPDLPVSAANNWCTSGCARSFMLALSISQ